MESTLRSRSARRAESPGACLGVTASSSTHAATTLWYNGNYNLNDAYLNESNVPVNFGGSYLLEKSLVNDSGRTTVTGYSATTGYDLATGLGSPIANTLVAFLSSVGVTPTLVPVNPLVPANGAVPTFALLADPVLGNSAIGSLDANNSDTSADGDSSSIVSPILTSMQIGNAIFNVYNPITVTGGDPGIGIGNPIAIVFPTMLLSLWPRAWGDRRTLKPAGRLRPCELESSVHFFDFEKEAL